MVIFNEAKPKYEHLDLLLEDYINNIRYSNQVNMIVDLKEITRKFFRDDLIQNAPKAVTIEEISSDIINIIAHYRNYFFKKSKYTNFYFLYSYEKCNELLKINTDYKKDYYDKYFNPSDPRCDIIKKSVMVIQKVIEKIPHAYFIDTSRFDEFVYVKYLKEKVIHENELTLVLSNDELFTQLVNRYILMLTPKGIKAELVTSDNSVKFITKNEEANFNSGLIPFFIALSGNKKLTINSPSTIAKKRAEKTIEHLVSCGKIIENNSIEFPIDFTKLDGRNKLENILINNRELLLTNYKLVRQDELLYSNLILIMNDLISATIHNNIMPVVDIMKKLNEKIFSLYPLQIDMILKGEEK